MSFSHPDAVSARADAAPTEPAHTVDGGSLRAVDRERLLALRAVDRERLLALRAGDRRRLRALLERGRREYVAGHPHSLVLCEDARGSLLAGVPMSWTAGWPGGFPVYSMTNIGIVLPKLGFLDAARVTLEHVLTEEDFARMIALCTGHTRSVQPVIVERRAPWSIVQIGARAEHRFTPEVPRSGGESATAHDAELDEHMHPYTINRGTLMTPFHDMALMCPAPREADVDRHTLVFGEAAAGLFADRGVGRSDGEGGRVSLRPRARPPHRAPAIGGRASSAPSPSSP